MVGVVPTMGFLHVGHRSLMAAARNECGLVVVTIFVNPLQFGPNEDLDRYPRDLDGDLSACAAEGVDIVFTPSVHELYPMYPPATTVHVEGLTDSLCGFSRPGHFDGVTTVVTKLFAIIGESRAYFGRKDAQQLAVIRRMATDLCLPVTVVGCPLVREADGLAKSSRNAYLDPDQRSAAPRIFGAIREGVAMIVGGTRDPHAVVASIAAAIAEIPELRVDYVAVCDAASLGSLERLDGEMLIAVAVFCGPTRLIDNVAVSIVGSEVISDFGSGWVPEG